MKKITFFMSSMGRGGAERVVSILSEYYCKIGWRVDICMLLHNINQYPLDNSVNVLDFSCESMGKAKRTISMLKKIRHYLKTEKPDVAVPFLAKTAVLFRVASLGINLKNTRVVASERIDPYSVSYSPLLRILVNYSYKQADAVVFQTKRAMSYYSKSIRKKGVIIGNPINAYPAYGDDGTHTIITAGRLTAQKNQSMLISAFSKISKAYPSYFLHIYGDGELKEALKKQIEKLNMTDRIFLMGNCLDYKEKLKDAEIFVLPSNYEGLSNALLEAMLMGKPCISTACAGSDEVIENYVNGILVPVNDAGAMERALVTLITNEKLKKTLSENAAKLQDIFSAENVIGQWRKIFES